MNGTRGRFRSLTGSGRAPRLSSRRRAPSRWCGAGRSTSPGASSGCNSRCAVVLASPAARAVSDRRIGALARAGVSRRACVGPAAPGAVRLGFEGKSRKTDTEIHSGLVTEGVLATAAAGSIVVDPARCPAHARRVRGMCTTCDWVVSLRSDAVSCPATNVLYGLPGIGWRFRKPPMWGCWSDRVRVTMWTVDVGLLPRAMSRAGVCRWFGVRVPVAAG